MSLELYLAYVFACVVLVIVPGPNVTVIIANSLRGGVGAGLASVAGAQLGLFIVLCMLAAGFHFIVKELAVIFELIRIIGAGYLVWVGIGMLRNRGRLSAKATGIASKWACFWQGCVVLLSNPKVMIFFGAFIPQFLDPGGDVWHQSILLGVTFMVVATILDSGYAFAAGSAGRLLSRSRIRLVEKISGLCMIGGGLWLALSRR